MALIDKVLGWYIPPAPRIAFSAGQIARGLAHFKSIGCPTRSRGQCPRKEELFGCADCTLEDAKLRLPPLEFRSDSVA